MRARIKIDFIQWIFSTSENIFYWLVFSFCFSLAFVRLCFFFRSILFFNNGVDSDLLLYFFPLFLFFLIEGSDLNDVIVREIIAAIAGDAWKNILCTLLRGIIIFFFSALLWFLMRSLRNSL